MEEKDEELGVLVHFYFCIFRPQRLHQQYSHLHAHYQLCGKRVTFMTQKSSANRFTFNPASTS